MAEEMVLRSVYLRPSEDMRLRQLAYDLNVTKSDLIRSAISVKLRDWLDVCDQQLILGDVALGMRSEAAIRSGRGKVSLIEGPDEVARPQCAGNIKKRSAKTSVGVKSLAAADA